ncbi:hypothetical protein FHS83_002231 [Rhizomicrobium palustre]|uniref:Uncharacterized protein n=1 Tax=Rhizomicrobium palustre TaxID=189966 RepID=A0A846N029_9PROT|nr:hypothetical protein [Rhizomicrobium palustre]NIK88913.1 hypothetical protein [Rhizomicrobium palustre]
MSTEPPVSVSPDDVHAHPRHTGHSRIDLILALTAIFLSAVSLFVAIEHGRTQRDLVAASTWPYVGVSLSNSANEKGDIVIGISNDGVGPAKLQSFEVFYKGKPVSSGLDLLRRCCGLSRERKEMAAVLNDHYFFGIVEHKVIRAGEGSDVVTLRPNPDKPEVSKRFAGALGNLSFRGCYCSVLDECWISDMSSTKVTKTKECPVPEHPFDPNGR